MIQDDPNQPGYGMPSPEGYGDYESAYTNQRASYGSIPQGMLMGGYTVGAGAMSGMSNMMADVGRMVRPVGYTPPARVMSGYGGMYVQQGDFLSGVARYAGFGNTPRGVTEYEYNYHNAADVGERVAGAATSAAAMAGGLAFGATAGSAMARGVGAFAGSALGPVGASVGGAVGGLFGGYALGMWAAGQVTDGVAQRREIQNFLESSSFRFATSDFNQADPRFGAGMNVGARRQVADYVRQMDVKDPTMSTEDLTQVLQQSSQLGLFQGSKDVKDFQKQFKDIVENVKVVTKTLHQTLEEGLKTIKDLKAIGYDPSLASSLVLQADSLGKMAGRTGAEMVGMGLQGAELFRGTGIEMKIGYQSNVMGLAAIRAARDAGEISQEAIAQAGGEEALAQRQTATSLGFAQSAMGRGFAAAHFRAGQGLDQAGFQQMMLGGGGDFAQTALQAARNLGDPRKVVEYQANQAKYLSEMGKQFGGQGLELGMMNTFMQQARFMTQNGAAPDIETGLKYSLLQAGVSQPEVDAMLGRLKNAPQEFLSAQRALQATHDKMVYEQAALNSPLNRLESRVGDVVKGAADVIARPMNALYDNMREGIIDFKMKHWYGIQSVNTNDLTTGGMERGAFYQAGNAGRAIDLDVGMSSLGEYVADVAVSGAYERTFGEKLGRRGFRQSAKEGDVVLDTNRMMWGGMPGSGDTFIASEKELQDASRKARQMLRLEERSKDAKVTSGQQTAAHTNVQKLLMEDTTGMSYEALLTRISGKDAASLSAEELAATSSEMGKIPELRTRREEGLTTLRKIAGVDAGAYIQHQLAAEEKLSPVIERMAGTLDRSLGIIQDGTRVDTKLARRLASPIARAKQAEAEAKSLRAAATFVASSPEEAKKLEDQAVEKEALAKSQIERTNEILAAEGMSAKDRPKVLAALANISAADAKTLVTEIGGIESRQAGLGHTTNLDLIRDAVASKLTGNKGAVAAAFLSKYQADPVKAMVESTKDELSSLGEAGGAAAGMAATAGNVRELLKGGKSHEEAKQLVEKIAPLGDQRKKEELLSAYDAQSATQKDLVGDLLKQQDFKSTGGQASTAAGAGGPGDSNAEVAMRTQTEINQNILMALSALAVQLGGKR